MLLRLPHELDDPGNRGVLARASDLHMQQAVAVDSPRVDLFPLALVARYRFAGDRTFIHARLSALDQAVGGDPLARANHDDVAGNQLFDCYLDLLAVTQQHRLVRQLLDKAMDRGCCPARGIGLQAFADEHDEHRLGCHQILADGECRQRGDADRQIGGDLLLHQIADGVVEGFVAGEERQQNRRIDGDAGERNRNRREQVRRVQQQQQPDECREADVLDALAAVPVDRMVFANNVQCLFKIAEQASGTIAAGESAPSNASRIQSPERK